MLKQTTEGYVPISRVWILAPLKRKWVRRVVPWFALTVLCYVGSYACLSAFGQFQPSRIGAGAGGISVRDYAWAPAGFANGYRHRREVFYFYLPLWLADHHYWHRYDDAYSGKYPVSTPSNAAEWAEWRR